MGFRVAPGLGRQGPFAVLAGLLFAGCASPSDHEESESPVIERIDWGPELFEEGDQWVRISFELRDVEMLSFAAKFRPPGGYGAPPPEDGGPAPPMCGGLVTPGGLSVAVLNAGGPSFHTRLDDFQEYGWVDGVSRAALSVQHDLGGLEDRRRVEFVVFDMSSFGTASGDLFEASAWAEGSNPSSGITKWTVEARGRGKCWVNPDDWSAESWTSTHVRPVPGRDVLSAGVHVEGATVLDPAAGPGALVWQTGSDSTGQFHVDGALDPVQVGGGDEGLVWLNASVVRPVIDVLDGDASWFGDLGPPSGIPGLATDHGTYVYMAFLEGATPPTIS